MKSIVEVIVALVDLIEAEKRQLSLSAWRGAVAFAALAFGAAMLLISVIFLLWALHSEIQIHYGVAAASFYTAIAGFIIAGGSLWGTRKLIH